MAKTETIDIDTELQDSFSKAFEQRDRFVLSVLQGHKNEPSDRQKYNLRGQSLFKYLAPLWRELTTEEKSTWATAGAASNISNWQLFISDNAARIKNGLILDVPPSPIWQVRTGFLSIQSPATELKLIQEHPLDYWISRKMRGKPWKQELVKIQERITLPIDLQLSYKSDLTTVGGEQIAKYSVILWYSYQGVDHFDEYSIEINAEQDWTVDNISTPSSVVGHLIGYFLVIHIKGYTGEVLFDNIKAIHTEQNWARDPRCDDIGKIFTKAFAIVKPFWIPEILPSGASYNTVFPPAL